MGSKDTKKSAPAKEKGKAQKPAADKSVKSAPANKGAKGKGAR